MDQNRVSKAVTLSLKGVLYDHSEGNDETLAACAGNKRLIPAATLDPRKHIGDKSALKALQRAGFKFLRLFPDLQGGPIRYAPVRSMLGALQETNMPLLINAPTYGMATEIADLVAGWSFPVILSGVGYWTMSEAIVLMRGQENILVETSYLDSPDAIEILVREVGSDRVLFGSNTPVTYFRGPYLSVVRSNVSERDKEAILYLNAQRVIGGIS